MITFTHFWNTTALRSYCFCGYLPMGLRLWYAPEKNKHQRSLSGCDDVFTVPKMKGLVSRTGNSKQLVQINTSLQLGEQQSSCLTHNQHLGQLDQLLHLQTQHKPRNAAGLNSWGDDCFLLPFLVMPRAAAQGTETTLISFWFELKQKLNMLKCNVWFEAGKCKVAGRNQDKCQPNKK